MQATGGFILVGSGEWDGGGVMTLTARDGLCFSVLRGTVATIFPTKNDALGALWMTNSNRREGLEKITAKVVRLIPAPNGAR